MKENPRQYLDMPASEKRKKAVEWCMRLLRLDIDSMSDQEFYDFVEEYNQIVAYPEPIGIRFPFTDPEEEGAARGTFKEYQKAGREIISDFEKIRDNPRHWVRLSTKMKFTVKANKNGMFSILNDVEHDFEYSYGWRIARLLNGLSFDDVIKKCPVCENYFEIFSKHKKQCCSHKCSMRHTFKKKSEKDLKLHRKRNNLQSHFSVLKKKGWTDKKIRSSLNSYVKSKKYTGKMIPEYIKKFIDNRG